MNITRREFLKLSGAFGSWAMAGMPELNIVNPYRGRVWSQVNDAWGNLDLPGKKPIWLNLENKARVAGCSAAAVTYAVNLMADPGEIYKLTGNLGVTPEDVIFKIFPKLPNYPLLLSAKGGNAFTVVDTLKYFGLSVDTPSLSKYSMNLIKPDELAVIGISIGTTSTHYTVYSRTDDTGATYVYDSFFGGGGREVRLDSYLPEWDIISVIRISNHLNDRAKNN